MDEITGLKKRVVTQNQQDAIFSKANELLVMTTGHNRHFAHACRVACDGQGCKDSDCTSEVLWDALCEALNNCMEVE